SSAMLTNGYKFCSMRESTCNTGQSFLIISKQSDKCRLVFLRTEQFTEVSGRRYQNRRLKFDSLLDKNFKANLSIFDGEGFTNTPIVLVTNKSYNAIRFVRKEE